MLNILADALLLVTRYGPLAGDAPRRTLTEADPRDAVVQRHSLTRKPVK
ncbi:hypothetical protein [Tabrizicola sp. BL-A-41-H6]